MTRILRKQWQLTDVAARFLKGEAVSLPLTGLWFTTCDLVDIHCDENNDWWYEVAVGDHKFRVPADLFEERK